MAAERDGHATRAPAADRGPVLAPPGAAPATASRPDAGIEHDERVHGYESNPAPWWIGLLWVVFFVFGATYLIVNLLR